MSQSKTKVIVPSFDCNVCSIGSRQVSLEIPMFGESDTEEWCCNRCGAPVPSEIAERAQELREQDGGRS